MNKFLLIQSVAIITSTTPGFFLIACSTSSQDEKIIDKEKDQKKFTIDLEKTNTVEDFLQTYDDYVKVQMPEIAYKLVEFDFSGGEIDKSQKAISEKSFNKLQDYTNSINYSNRNLEITYKGKKEEFDLSQIEKEINNLKESLKVGYSKVKSYKEVNDMVTTQFGALSPNIIATTSHSIGFFHASKLAGFMAIPGQGYDHYLNMLDAYSKFSYSLCQSQLYSDWVKDKTYTLLERSSDYVSLPKIIKVKPGEHFDDKNNPVKIDITIPKNPNQLNNFEAQLGLTILNIYSIVEDEKRN